MSKTKTGAALGMTLAGLMLAASLTGGAAPIGFSTECTNLIDDDLDGFVDNCGVYPYTDGNGEDLTLIEDRYLGESYRPYIYYVWEHAGPELNDPDPTFYCSQGFEDLVIDIQENISNGKDRSHDIYIETYLEYCTP